ncbi:unnamed protein product [Psylliodes chrysocephalus]|uniref:Cytochrome b5 heme-binding domain-containing protein n=1 Tax=Psylliodes chrysocephalus TaxID=3402493 RepID=A0A9P0D2U1_9CUCU|nr:unnamed protein product [Psylliodes chrysocephala]
MVEATTETTETQFYTLEQIAKYNGKQEDNTVWIIIRDNVYDVSPFLEEHPGGADLIMEWAGKDATKEFDNFGHSSDAKKDLKRLKIGEVVEEQRKKKTKKTEQTNQIAKQKAPKVVDVTDGVGRSLRAPVIEPEELAREQNNDQELQDLLKTNNSFLKLQLFTPFNSSQGIYCDVSEDKIRPFAAKSLRNKIFSMGHRMAHPGARRTINLIRQRIV